MFFLVSRTRYRIIVLSLVGIKSSLCLAEDYVFGSVGLTGFFYNNKHYQPVLERWLLYLVNSLVLCCGFLHGYGSWSRSQGGLRGGLLTRLLCAGGALHLLKRRLLRR